MFKLLDKYVFFSFMNKLLWALVSAIVVFLVVDLVEHLDKFIDGKAPLMLILRYYYLYLPYVTYLILPVATLLATLFTVGSMTMTNELVAIKVAGVSFFRPLMVLLIASSACAFGTWVLGETVIPPTNRERLDIMRYDVKRLPRENRAKHGRIFAQISPTSQIYLNHYKMITKEAFEIQISDVEDGEIIKRIDAEKMVWRNNKWLVQSPVERTFYPDGSVTWRRNFDLSISGAGLRPDEFERVRTKPEELNAAELKEFISRLKSYGGETIKWEVELLAKTTQPIAAVVIVLFGAPLASVKRRGGTTLGFALSLFVCFIYFGFIQVGKVMGINGEIAPWFAAWIGNICFGVLGVIFLVKTDN